MRGSVAVPDVSFVVITYNEETNIVNCLSSITSQIGAGSIEVLVVDDGSSDRTADVVAEFAVDRPEIVLLQHPFNRGRGAARETGINAARGELVAMVDADIVLPANWLQCCRAALTDNVDAVGGIPVPDGDVSFLYRRFGMHPRPVPPTVPVTGANGLYRRRVFELVGVDPSLAEGEDIALNHAMAQAGLIARNLPEVLVEHRENKGFLRSIRWLYQSGIGASRQWARYGEVTGPRSRLRRSAHDDRRRRGCISRAHRSTSGMGRPVCLSLCVLSGARESEVRDQRGCRTLRSGNVDGRGLSGQLLRRARRGRGGLRARPSRTSRWRPTLQPVADHDRATS